MSDKNPIIVALDVNEVDDARRLVAELSDHVGLFKIGLEFQMSQLARLMAGTTPLLRFRCLRAFYQETKGRLMWDGKFDDIPNTIGRAVEGLGPISPWGFTIQASSGSQGIAQAVVNRGNSKVLGVTVLTSLGSVECRHVYGALPNQVVVRFAEDLRSQGADGIVCSADELVMLGTCAELDTLERVVPGIRPVWADHDDQSRVMTPKNAVMKGADWLVIGRPITRPPDGISQVDAAKRILAEIFG